MEASELTLLVEQAKEHDNHAIEQLYNQYHNSVYFLCLKIIKNEDNALDLVQDTFLQAFNKLDTLQNPAQFGSWLNQIAANKCRDFLKKKKPLLFCDKTDENDDSEEFIIENKDESLIPDKVVDNAETRRLVMGIIDNLPDLQRMTVMLYYYEEKSVAQIAEIMECSENTVKSRLNYARKQIKEQVLALEKDGTKLYAVMPMLFPLLHNAAADFAMPSTASSALLQHITSSVAANTAGAASSSTTTSQVVSAGTTHGSTTASQAMSAETTPSSTTASQAVPTGTETTESSSRVIAEIHKVRAKFLKLNTPTKIGVCAAVVAVLIAISFGVAAASHHNVPAQTTMASLTSNVSSSPSISLSSSGDSTSVNETEAVSSAISSAISSNQEASSPTSKSTSSVISNSKTVSSAIASKQEKSSTTADSGIPVSSISLSNTSFSLPKGRTATIKATMFPQEATNKEKLWKSSNPEIATVDQSGNITAVGIGTCTITVTSACDKSVVNEVKVKVLAELIGEAFGVVKAYDEDTLTIHFSDVVPTNSTDGLFRLHEYRYDKNTYWGQYVRCNNDTVQSSDPSVIKMVSGGFYKVLKCGTTKIIMYCPDVNEKKIMTITVQ